MSTVCQLLHGDCREVLRGLPDACFDAVVTDPPYDLTSKRPGGRSPATEDKVMRGFMGMSWDATGVAFDPTTWREALRVLKPGGHMVVFGGSRTFHRVACAVEDAGFEIRDTIMWLYGSGFPKSANQHGEWEGWGTALKPAHEPIILARRPLDGTVADNLLRWGVGALNVDGCRVPADDGYVDNAVTQGINTSRTSYAPACARRTFEPSADGRWPANVAHDGSDEVLAAFPDAPGQIADAKFDTRERKTQNVYGSMRRERGDEPSADSDNNGAVGFKMKPGARRLDAGSAARFFYCAKASRADRDEGCEAMNKKPLLWNAGTQNPGSFQSPGTDRSARNHHPTVKPVDLMRWLVRMVTPRGGLVLDPFAGSGSTGKACALEGANCVLVELTAEYLPIIRARCAAAGHAVLG